MITVDLDQELKNIDGSPMVNSKQDPSPAKLRQVVVQSLLSDADAPDGDKKLRRFALARAIMQADKEEFSQDELDDIKFLVAKIHPSLICGQCLEMLGGFTHA